MRVSSQASESTYVAQPPRNRGDWNWRAAQFASLRANAAPDRGRPDAASRWVGRRERTKVAGAAEQGGKASAPKGADREGKGELDTPLGIREQNLPEADIGRIRSINSSARTGNEGGLATPSAVCGSSCKKSGRPVDQPIGRHCADRVGCDYVETTNRSLDQIGLDAKRHCLAQQPSHR